MKHIFNISFFASITLVLLIFVGCDEKIERSGIVVDQQTHEPLQDVLIEIMFKQKTKDSLNEKVLTDQNGYFFISERKSKKQLYELSKSGYVKLSSFLTVKNDTTELERVTN